METILENVRAITWQMLLMWCIGGGLIYLAIRKNMEPALLLPMGFRGHSGEPAVLRGHHPGSGSRPSGRAVSGGHRQ